MKLFKVTCITFLTLCGSVCTISAETIPKDDKHPTIVEYTLSTENDDKFPVTDENKLPPAIVTDDCTSSISVGSETLTVPFEKECKEFTYLIKSPSSSIISISISLNSSLVTNSSLLENDTISITLRETVHRKDTKPSTLTEQWILNAFNITDDIVYYTQTPRVLLTVTAVGNWSGQEVQIIDKEIAFRSNLNVSTNNPNGTVTPWEKSKGRHYRPNSVYFFHIKKAPHMDVKSIDLILHTLDIDAEVGEYLLIGSGTPFKTSPPLFLTSSPPDKKFKINDESGYFVFVAAATRTNRTGFNFTWFQRGEEISKEKEKIQTFKQDDVLQAVPICLYNITAAKEEMNKSNAFIEFRTLLAIIGTEYAQMNRIDRVINESHVQIFRVSGKIPPNSQREGLHDGALHASVKVQGKQNGSAAFTYNQLKEIVEIYSKKYSEEINGYKIGFCATANAPTKMWKSISIYIVIPILCCLFLFIWTWQYNPLNKMLMKKVAKTLQGREPVETDDNIYTTEPSTGTLPTVRITSDNGRRYTLNFEQMAMTCADDNSDTEIYNRAHNSRGFSSQDSARNSVRSSNRGQINNGFEDDESILPATQSLPTQETEGTSQAADHVYDSLKSVKDRNKSALEDDMTRM